MKKTITTHHRYQSSELYTIGTRHYFGCNGVLYILTEDTLLRVLKEVEAMNPLECAKYLMEQADKRFKKISK